jgi:predicted DNA-binding transcriptional regulator AlpA
MAKVSRGAGHGRVPPTAACGALAGCAQERCGLALMTIAEVCRYLGGAKPLHWTTIYKWCRDRGFPRPIKLGAATARWRRSEIDAWIGERTSQSHVVGLSSERS